jgi:adenosylcobinamide-phosphate guanylyltransferase
MGVTAVVMAGGKGSRMAFSEEKPLVQVGGKPLIEHVLRSLQQAKKVDSIVVAVSDYTPRTAVFAGKFPVRVVKTPGKEYVSDMQFAVRKLGLETVLAIGADLPLITGEVIDAVLGRYELSDKPALAVVVPLETKAKLGLSLEYAFQLANKTVVPAGINVIDGRRIDEEELDQEICVMDNEEVAVNINTPKELKLAEALFKKSA